MFAVAICGAACLSSSAALTATKVSEAERPSSDTYGAAQISGITWAGGKLFYAVDDNDGKLYPLTLDINLSNGSLATANIAIGTGVTMAGSHDMEGCAYDPASGNVWISQETNALIREFDPATGEMTRSAPVPAIFKKYRGNFSLEALTISGDGMTMWTANEEALYPDGTNTTKTMGTVVRLARFTRESVYDGWTADGQWAYKTDSGYPLEIAGVSDARHGVSALTALPDGTLLVLERGYGRWGSLADDFKNYIYAVNFTGATDITGVAALTNATYTATKKSKVFGDNTFKYVNYEGMCLGPRLDDGSVSLVIIADGGGSSFLGKKVMTMKLTGIDVRTLDFEAPGSGVASISGGPYRYVGGATVDVALDGVEYASCYTNNMAVCTNVAWECGSNSGSGSLASFSVSEDATFEWVLTEGETVSTPIDFADNFESYPVGADVAEGEVGRWTGDGEVVARETPALSTPMLRDPHTQVLDVETLAACDFPCTTNGNDMVEMMLTVRRRQPDEDDSDADDSICALMCAEDGRMLFLCAAGWVRLSDKVYENGDWVRVSFKLMANAAGDVFVQPRLDGESCKTASGVHSPLNPVSPGAWYPCRAGRNQIASLSVHGTVQLDDVIKTVEGYEPETAAATIDGIPVAWLRSSGFGLDPNAPATLSRLRALGYTIGDVYLAGLDPEVDDPFNFTGMRILDDGRLELVFNGIDRTGSAYRVCRMEELGGEEVPVAGEVEVDEENYTTVWTSLEPIDGEKGFYVTRINDL